MFPSSKNQLLVSSSFQFYSNLSALFQNEDGDPDVENDFRNLVLEPVAEDGDVRVEEEERREADAAAGVLDDRRAVEDVQLLELAQVAAIVAKAWLYVMEERIRKCSILPSCHLSMESIQIISISSTFIRLIQLSRSTIAVTHD